MKKHPKAINFSELSAFLIEREPYLLQKLESALGYDRLASQKGLEEVVKFLYLIYFTETRLTPSLKIDLIWHELILFTKTYHTFCNHFFERYIHHHPGGDDDNNERNFRKALQLYVLYIGEPPSLFWGEHAKEVYEDAQCGAS